VVEWHTHSELVAVDLSKCRYRIDKHITIGVMHRHRIICQVDRRQRKTTQVLFVFISVLKEVPVHPKVSQLWKMIQIFKLRHLVHCEVEKAKIGVCIKIFNSRDLVLLEI